MLAPFGRKRRSGSTSSNPLTKADFFPFGSLGFSIGWSEADRVGMEVCLFAAASLRTICSTCSGASAGLEMILKEGLCPFDGILKGAADRP